ncbi:MULTISPECIES: GNAT family N-acetyltransferase [Kitasatospora]|uniref:GNAT family N-acetyltransferase n=1 Tax=Kitasatospora TaxID=2063 RepID=UPI0015D59C11|nr:GNAT family N-acetyltransferase [Kitasatospora sp. GP30]
MNHTDDGPVSLAAPTTTQTIAQATARPPELLDLPDGFVLRRRTLADADTVNEVIVRDLEHLRPWMAWATTAPTLERSREMTKIGWQLWEDGTDFMYVLGRADQPGSVLGMFGLHRRIGPGAIEIGYWVAREYTGRSLATNGAAALTEAALALPDVERVEIHCDQANAASAAVPRKLGYRLDRVHEESPTTPAETGKKLIWIKERTAC